MTRMLASVGGEAEALAAQAGGADILDLVAPSGEALPEERIRSVIAAIDGRCRVGASLPHPTAERVAALATYGIDHLMLPAIDEETGAVRAAPVASGIELVAVLYAEQGPELGILPALVAAGYGCVLLDTLPPRAGVRGTGRLLSHLSVPELARFTAAARVAGLSVGLAGALEPPDIPRLLVMAPDILGFRSALRSATQPGRRSVAPLSQDAIARIRGLIPRDQEVVGPGDDRAGDRIFVHDLVLPVRVGDYAHEHHGPQKVRFNVDVVVARTGQPVQDMRDVLSYDLISDGIRILVDAGHTRMLETLAERIAAMLLAQPRARKVLVQLEKLQTGSGVMGVAIERSK